MKKYNFSFNGRQSGAIGITYQIAQTYEANSIEEACTMLYTDYEQMHLLKLNGEYFKIQSKHLEHPETLKKYKGLKNKRK